MVGGKQSGDSVAGVSWSVGETKLRGSDYHERLISHNVLVASGTLGAGVLGFAFQSLISHRLAPSEYGGVFAVMSLLTLLTLPAAALTLLMARESSRDRATGHVAASAALLRSGNQALVLCGLVLAAVVVATSSLLASFFNIPTSYLLATAMSLPFALALPLLTGELQGEQRFGAFVLLTTGQAALKLVAAIGFGLAFGPAGVVLGLASAIAVIYAVALALLRRKLAVRVRVPWLSSALKYLAVVLPSTVAVSVLLSADVLLVKHFFNSRAAGEYAAVAAIGRGIFYGAAGIAAVLFPKVVFHETQGKSGFRLVATSILLVLAGGAAAMVILLVGSRLVLAAFAGTAYVGGSTYAALYAMGMILLGCSSVLIATYQSRAKSGFLAALIPLTLLEPALIIAFHNSLTQVVQMLNVSMAVLVAGLVGPFVWQSRSRANQPLVLEPRPAEVRL